MYSKKETTKLTGTGRNKSVSRRLFGCILTCEERCFSRFSFLKKASVSFFMARSIAKFHLMCVLPAADWPIKLLMPAILKIQTNKLDNTTIGCPPIRILSWRRLVCGQMNNSGMITKITQAAEQSWANKKQLHISLKPNWLKLVQRLPELSSARSVFWPPRCSQFPNVSHY